MRLRTADSIANRRARRLRRIDCTTERTTMRDFNQASLDEHLANLTQNLTPEQAQQVKERVREKASGGWFDMPPDAIDGAFDLVGAVLNGIVALPDIGSAGGKVGSVLSGLDPRQLGGV